MVALTRLQDEGIVVQAIAAGAQECLIKEDITIRRLITTIRSAMARVAVMRLKFAASLMPGSSHNHT